MQVVKGIPVSPGVVVGRIAVVDDAQGRRVPRRELPPDADAEAEVARFDAARRASIEDLERVHASATRDMGKDAAAIFLFHIGMLNDRAILDPIAATVRGERVVAEYAVAHVFRAWATRFSQQQDTAFRTKVNDLQDLSDRLIARLTGRARGVPVFDGPTIVVARDLTPSQTAGFDRATVCAFVTQFGGPTSHTAIVARALELPAVVGCERITEVARDGDLAIVDGERGTVTLAPDDKALATSESSRRRAEHARIALQETSGLPAVTADGVEIELHGNIEFPDEAASVVRTGGTGVGLYRTEFLYLTNNTEPTEQDHYSAYARCIELLAGRPLTIRTVDLGADKYTQERAAVPERNPFLGLRSIRYCLQNLPMFTTQLRAILRASALGPVRIMFPLITSTQEFRQAKHLVHDAMEDLDEARVPFDRGVPIGMMVEVPSAAILIDAFARDADFFSIGTNDLVQYTLAVDRTNERVADLYQPAHPAVVKLIRDVVRAAKHRERSVSCCGEAAGDPAMAHLLIGLGLRTLSVTSGSIPLLKRMVRALTITECELTARKALSFDSENEAAAFIRDRARKLVPEVFDGRLGD